MDNKSINHSCNNDEIKCQVIVLNTSKGIMTISSQQIIRIQAISNYSKLFFSDGKTLVVTKVLHWLQEQSSFFSFIRIHRSHLINPDYIQSYSSKKNGFLYLRNNEMFPIAKRKKTGLAKQLNNFIFFNEDIEVTG